MPKLFMSCKLAFVNTNCDLNSLRRHFISQSYLIGVYLPLYVAIYPTGMYFQCVAALRYSLRYFAFLAKHGHEFEENYARARLRLRTLQIFYLAYVQGSQSKTRSRVIFLKFMTMFCQECKVKGR